MIRAIADTHTFIWYLAGDKRLSVNGREFIDAAAREGDTIAVSSITLVETVYLMERNRVPADTLRRLVEELVIPNGVFVEVPIDHQVATIMQQVSPNEIPDMPDRIIAATALHHGVPVISRDGRIQASSIQTIW
jgi:PIN domain nuclease of toxin-antitoxin system